MLRTTKPAAAAEQAHAADRFARKIVGFLTVLAVRSQRLMGIPLGGWGSVVGIPFWSHALVSNVHARCVRLVVPVPVVQAWFDGSWCSLPVVQRVIVYWAWFHRALVVQA